MNVDGIRAGLDAIAAEKGILENDLAVMNAIVKSILNSRVVQIDGELYFRAEDIVRVCREGFASLSSGIAKAGPDGKGVRWGEGKS